MNAFVPDRYWWLRAVQGAVSAVVGGWALVVVISDVWGGEHVAVETWGLLCALCWGTSILSTWQAIEAHRRFRARLQAMQGTSDGGSEP